MYAYESFYLHQICLFVSMIKLKNNDLSVKILNEVYCLLLCM